MKIFLYPLVLISLGAADIERAVTDHLKAHYPLEKAEYICDFSRLNLRQVPEFDSVAIDGYGKDLPRGQVVVRFSFFNRGERIYKTNGTVKVGILKNVLTASTPIKSGMPLDMENLIFQQRDISELNEEPLVLSEQLINKVALNYIPSGRIITASLAGDHPAVRPGDKVEIIYNSGSLTLKANGIVKQPGSEGDRVRVMNTDTRKVVYALVADSLTVVISQ